VGAPQQAGEGKATAKISFPGLKMPVVAPATAEILVKKAPAGTQATPVK
jgi:hypothetical protein